MGAKACAALAAGLCLVFAAGEGRAQSHPPVEAFAQLPGLSDPELSPDGKHIAFKQSLKGTTAVTIYEIGGPPGTKPALVQSDDWVIQYVQWAKNDRLALYLRKAIKAPGDGKIRTWTRIVTVSTTAGDPVMLNENQGALDNNVSGSGIVDDDLDDPDRVFLPFFVLSLAGENPIGDPNSDNDFRLDIMEVNAHTGVSHSFMAGNPKTIDWYMDGHGHVVARIDQSRRPLVDHLKFYDGSDWHDAGTFDASGDKGVGLEGLSEDGTAFVFKSYDKQSMVTLVADSLAKPGQETVLFANPQYDLAYAITDAWTGRIIGAAYADDRVEHVYFDPKLEALQRGIEQAFPGLSAWAVSSDLARDRAILEVEGPKQPPTYYFLDRTSHNAQILGSAYPNLTAADLGDMRPYPYQARDGLDIHAYLTLPPGSDGKNLPLVVMPHGGPEARDAIGFDWIAQFFANRGYAVFQPNYRGSSGYGHKFVEAGFGQWGLKMQDDVTDGVKKLIADGIVDPKRVCIVGGSYGGYAALAGAAFTPDLYACAVSFAGVSDLPSMMSTERSDNGSYSQTVSYWLAQFGNDSEDLSAASPARHADQVKCPILLMHGENDTTVRILQSELMYNALKAAGKDVQFIRIPGEDHYLSFADTRARFLSETEKFLAAQIGQARPMPK